VPGAGDKKARARSVELSFLAAAERALEAGFELDELQEMLEDLVEAGREEDDDAGHDG